MSKYIVKKSPLKKTNVKCKLGEGYSFSPKVSKYPHLSKVTVYDQNLQKGILNQKIERDYKKIVMRIYELLSEGSDGSSNVLVTYTELDRLRKIFLQKYENKVKKEILAKYLKKLQILELEVKKLMLNLYHTYEMQNDLREKKGKGR